jgi:hypothetical protein
MTDRPASWRMPIPKQMEKAGRRGGRPRNRTTRAHAGSRRRDAAGILAGHLPDPDLICAAPIAAMITMGPAHEKKRSLWMSNGSSLSSTTSRLGDWPLQYADARTDSGTSRATSKIGFTELSCFLAFQNARKSLQKAKNEGPQ